MSSRSLLSILGILVLMGATAAVTIFIYVSVVGGSGEASEPISAPTLNPATPTPDPRTAQIAQLSTQVSELQATNAALIGSASGSQITEATAEANTQAQAAPAVDETALFRIIPDESEVRFTLTEDLRGVPTTVVGRTDQVAGDIRINFTAPAQSQLGVIRINARTLATDNNFRNGAIRDQILQSNRDEYEFSEFTPTAISGLPETVEIGQSVTFQITGDLKVRDIVKPVTFDVTVTVVSEDRLEGTATSTVQRDDFNLVIPSVPSVANVSEAVQLEIDFVAAKVSA